MQYKVIEWVCTSPRTMSAFVYVEPTEAIKQAIVNEIRQNGYMFDTTFTMCPILNTGEAVQLERELCEELICRAYGLSEDEYARYFDRVSKQPSKDLTAQSHFIGEYPTKRIVWINDEAFDDFQTSIQNGNSNVDIIPDDYIHLKKGDMVRYTSVDESKYFEVKVKDFLPGTVLTKISDIEKMNQPDTQSLIRLFSREKNELSDNALLYRYEGLCGKEIFTEFKRVYGTWFFSAVALALGYFDCNVNLIVFDKNEPFTQTILEIPDDVPVREDVLQSIHDAYAASVQEEQRRKDAFNQRVLLLKEKMAKRKQENDK